MGCICSNGNSNGNDNSNKNNNNKNGKDNDIITQKLFLKMQQEEKKIKYLLLGPGESGKSTIFKQMKILHGADMTDDELRLYGVTIRSNVRTVVVQLCELIRMLKVENELDVGYDMICDNTTTTANSNSNNRVAEEEDSGGDILIPSKAYKCLILRFAVRNVGPIERNVGPIEPFQPILEEKRKRIEATQEEREKERERMRERDWIGYFPPAGLKLNTDAQDTLELWELIKVLWKSKIMKDVWQKRALVNIVDGHKAFLNDIDRIVSPSYKPTLQDVLLARTKTTNVTVQRYTIGTTEFELYDVGGQRKYRNKWYDSFDGVDGVIFVAALSEYDQNLTEAKRTNRLMETLDVFRAICLNRAFVDTPIILFLNKIDLVVEKIRYSNIADQQAFADYDGPTNHFDCAVSYFIQKFEESLIQQGNKYRDIYIQTCTATDTEHIRFVMDATRDIITRENINRSFGHEM